MYSTFVLGKLRIKSETGNEGNVTVTGSGVRGILDGNETQIKIRVNFKMSFSIHL